MNSDLKQKPGDAQTLLEYTIVISVIVAVLLSMTPLLRRAVQGMVKLVADQVGNQVNSEQLGGKYGQIDYRYALTRADINKNYQESNGLINYAYSDETATSINSATNLGFTPDLQRRKF